MKRPNFLPAPHYFALNQAATLVNAAFGGFGCYLVGSCLERRDYRDVDVRLILEDAAYDRWFGPSSGQHESGGVHDPLWSLLCLAVSGWLKAQTGLPIDFQIQRQTQANAKHDGKRNALGIFLDYPGERPSDEDKRATIEASTQVGSAEVVSPALSGAGPCGGNTRERKDPRSTGQRLNLQLSGGRFVAA